MALFKSYVFEGRKTAAKALDEVEYNNDSYLWVDHSNVAEISVNKHGHVRVHSTWAQDSNEVPGGIGFGALLGGLLGMFFGPAGVMAGAATGGTIGGLIGVGANIEFSDPVLADFADSMKPDTSALILLGDQQAIDEFSAQLDNYGVKSFLTEIDAEATEALKKAMESYK